MREVSVKDDNALYYNDGTFDFRLSSNIQDELLINQVDLLSLSNNENDIFTYLNMGIGTMLGSHFPKDSQNSQATCQMY